MKWNKYVLITEILGMNTILNVYSIWILITFKCSVILFGLYWIWGVVFIYLRWRRPRWFYWLSDSITNYQRNLLCKSKDQSQFNGKFIHNKPNIRPKETNPRIPLKTLSKFRKKNLISNIKLHWMRLVIFLILFSRFIVLLSESNHTENQEQQRMKLHVRTVS